VLSDAFIYGCVPNSRVEVTFVRANGEQIKATGKEGDSLLDIVVNNSVDLEGYGACEGTLTCSTCHLIFKKEDFDRLPDKPTDEELDMLDLAYDLTDT
jgi:ferredoxin